MNFVLIPGAGGASYYWHLLVAELEARGHGAVAVDLPGDDDSKGLADYADLVVGAAPDGPVTVVAQSMGGFTAPRVVDRVDAVELCFVNAMIPKQGETAGDWWDNTGAAVPGADFDEVIVFLHDIPLELHPDLAKSARPQAGAWGDVGLESAYPDGLPIRALAGADDRLFAAGFQQRVAEERLGFTPDVRPGGHLIALSQPVAVADWLLSE